MFGVDLVLVIIALAFAMTVNSMYRHISSNQGYENMLINILYIYVSIGTIFLVGWIIYLGISIHWYTPIFIFIIAFLFNNLFMPIVDSKFQSLDKNLSCIGLVALPILGFLLLKLL